MLKDRRETAIHYLLPSSFARLPNGNLQTFANERAVSVDVFPRISGPIRKPLFLPLHLRRDFQTQRVEPDEAGGVVLVVGFGWVGFHRGDVQVRVHARFRALATGFSSGSTWKPIRRFGVSGSGGGGGGSRMFMSR